MNERRRDFLKNWQRAALILLAAVLGLAAFAAICRHDPKINFLSANGRAEWIVFPTAVSTGTRPAIPLDALFRKSFVLQDSTPPARVIVRGARRLELKINHVPVDLGISGNWKNSSTADITNLLHSGTNQIEARVFNDTGPPALWLALTSNQMNVRTDSTWEASFTGSSWRPVALASVPRFPGPGNLSAGGEHTREAWRTAWPIWLIFAGIAVVVLLSGRWWLKADFSRQHVIVLLSAVALLWIALFWNNARHLPFPVGFDAGAHVDYIKYVQERRALPLPHEGFEMFHPPLYYITSAVLLSAAHVSAGDASGIVLLRALTMLFGIAQVLLVFLTLRRLFPEQLNRQLAGVLLAGFLPMQIYLAHNVTNETLAAALMTAAIYVAVRLWQTEKDVSISGHVWLGLLLGAAMLTKTTAVLLVPPLFAALIARRILRRSSLSGWLGSAGVTAAVSLAVCGWHYVRLWRRLGSPLVGNWDPATGFLWWQDPGYRTVYDYLRFGRSLVSPFFSSFAGFWDGLYSTLWGDGLWGGLSDWVSRTPWNYSLMAGGYLLALAPTALILIGLAVVLRHYIVRPTLPWFLLLTFPLLLVSGLAYMALNVPSYATPKAVYGLSALIPLCCFGAIGFDIVTRGRSKVQFALGVLLLVWAGNSYASMWIRESSAQHVYRAARFRSAQKMESAMAEVTQAVQRDPADGTARWFLSLIYEDANRGSEALEQAERSVQLAPRDSASHQQLALVLAKHGEVERGMEEARRALEFGPENAVAYGLLLSCLIEARRDDEAIEVGRNALTVSPFSAEMHYALGVAAGRKQEFVLASHQFVYAMLLHPNWADARPKLRAAVIGMSGTDEGRKHLRELFSLVSDSSVILNDLAWLLATHPDAAVRDGKAAVELVERALAAKNAGINPTLLSTAAAAYAETGRFDAAINKAEQALALARASGNEQIATLSESLLASFQTMRPYRDNPR